MIAIDKAEAEKGAENAFRAVIEHGPKIELDHHLVYHAREFLQSFTQSCDEILMRNRVDYELGRLLANQGKVDDAKMEFELIISGMRLSHFIHCFSP